MGFINIKKAVEDSGICETMMIRHCNRGDIGFVQTGTRKEDILVNEEDVIDLMINQDKVENRRVAG